MSEHPVDAVLLLSFGGPEAPDEVRPFLENVVRGRNVPPERLDEVEEHYHHFGGMSPINGLNREIIAGLRRELAAAGYDLPVYFGNRNWHPFAEDTVTEMARDGIRNALVFATSAYGGYSACRQYHEDIARARAAAAERLGAEDRVPDLTKLRHFFDHPLFVGAVADGVREARARSTDPDARVVFTAHSVPVSADETAGPPGEGGHRYSRQVGEAARLAAAEAGVGDYDQVWQSRSGPPRIPWLDPQIEDHLDGLHDRGVGSVVVSPVGFVSDHIEIVFDLDAELAEAAEKLGMGFVRAASAGSDPRFVEMIVELIAEQVDDAPVRGLSTTVPRAGVGCNGTLCHPGCCEPPARRRPA